MLFETRFFFQPFNLVRLLANDLLIPGFFFSHLFNDFPGSILAFLEYDGGVLDELALPLAKHLRVQLILRGYLVQRRLLLDELQDQLGLKF